MKTKQNAHVLSSSSEAPRLRDADLTTLNDLERHLWGAAHIITGPIDAFDYKTYIFPILFFKRVGDKIMKITRKQHV